MRIICQHGLLFIRRSRLRSLDQASRMDVRIMLPRTVYLHQKKHLAKEEINIVSATLETGAKKIVCDVENRGFSLVRVQKVRITGPHASESTAGVPAPTRWEASPGTKLGREAAARDTVASFRALHAERVTCHSRQKN